VATYDVEDPRNERIFGLPELFAIKPFECELDDNSGTGTCLTMYGCKDRGGAAMGKCAVFGVCCYLNDVEGNTTISSTGGFFTSPGFSSSSTARKGRQLLSLASTTYTATLKPAADKVQMLVEFQTFDIVGPTEGDCNNDTFEITGYSGSLQIPILCGNNSGQHMYIDLSNYNANSGNLMVLMTLSSDVYARQWRIKISYFTAMETSHPLCLQYFTATSGTISSFNYGLTPQYLNNQMYSVCFAYLAGYCDIGFTFNNLNLDDSIGSCVNDYVQIQNSQLCGVETNYPVTGNATGPITMSVSSDGANANEVGGFELAYIMMAC